MDCPLSDLDIAVDSAESVVLLDWGKDFLVSHIHPDARVAQVLVQLLDVENSLRIDIFLAEPGTIRRAKTVPSGELCISLNDMLANLVQCFINAKDGRKFHPKILSHFDALVKHMGLTEDEPFQTSPEPPVCDRCSFDANEHRANRRKMIDALGYW